MAAKETNTESLRERLTGLLADWGAEMSMLLKQLDDAESEAGKLRAEAGGHEDKLKHLEERAKGQADLIETLKGEAAESSDLRKEVREKDLEIERLQSEIESKQELVRALRRDAEKTDQLKSDASKKDRTIESQAQSLKEAEEKIAKLKAEIENLAESSKSDAAEEHAEIAALKAELEARKSLIKGLRSDSGRVAALEEQLESKREIVGTLEESINQYVQTIAELKKSSEHWKAKYQALRNSDADASSASLPAFSETDVAAMQQLENQPPDRTVAIDMRRPLSEARRKAADRS